ncbi:AdeC/AdeK/OprM family multidrug efflux complex outer membrane factor [Uliginosibacterium sp. H3]|uniref:AdeC/AdeK/OprM family multidrug efflux complex outer membrane factor n=1 Tax=Uliginosibacterium silvisoli TaxID=3114758 RepID=A0ABU6K3G9_9RHOO|nr:AdeC/AdeK/OprM family multidrug efflux complex outer membrane factor [Uliginosibacterium sp. H3]
MYSSLIRKSALGLAVSLALSACVNLAPDYATPVAPTAASWPQGPAYKPAVQGTDRTVVADIGWREFFTDERLRKLIELSLANNRDLRVAALNIEKARALYQIQRADLLPTVRAVAGETASRTAATLNSSGQPQISHTYNVGVGFSSYELDFFGRVQNLKDAALQNFLATDEAQRSAQIALIAEVANTYLNLAADRERLQLSKDTYKSRQESHALTQRTFELGAASGLTLQQSLSTVEAARRDVAIYVQQVAVDENALTVLIGTQLPANLLPPELSANVSALRDLPAGVPSEVLQLRPDIRRAEHSLQAANANIGAARAAFFPSITLTASAGYASNALDALFNSGSGIWSFAPQISLPIFDYGRRSANLDVAKTDRDIALAQYDKAIQVAFREVADALAVRGTIDEALDAQRTVVDANTESLKLSEARLRSGIDSYLGVLDAQRSLYASQLVLIASRLSRQTNLVTLYKVLGGGVVEGKS